MIVIYFGEGLVTALSPFMTWMNFVWMGLAAAVIHFAYTNKIGPARILINLVKTALTFVILLIMCPMLVVILAAWLVSWPADSLGKIVSGLWGGGIQLSVTQRGEANGSTEGETA